MPSEPENKMEGLLKTYAKKRREVAGPSFELHPATRQLLQGEVVRRRAKSTGRFGSWLGLLAGLGPRIGFAASVLTVLGIVLWKFYPSGEATRRPAYVMAKTDRVPPAVPEPRETNSASPLLAAERPFRRQEAETAPFSGPRRTGLTLQSESSRQVFLGTGTESTQLDVLGPGSGEATRTRAPLLAADSHSSTAAGTDLTAPLSPAVPGSIPPPAPRSKLEKSAVLRSDDSPRLPALAAAPTPTAVETAPVNFADFKDRNYSTRSVSLAAQRFTRARNAEKPDPIPKGSGQSAILSTFDFYQTGNSIRIVDADGSVYEGPVMTGEGQEVDKAKSLRSEPARELNAVSQTEPSVRFRVSGTNRTVNQLVILNGSFQPSAGTAQMPRPSSVQTSESAALDAARTPLSLTAATRDPAKTVAGRVKLEIEDTSAIRSFPTARIQGKARVGKTEEMQIEAVPAAR